MTFAEFELLPEVAGKRELVEGEVTIEPPAAVAHSSLAKQILLLFLARLNQARVWPDQRRDDKYFLGSPMIAVEILSPREEIDHKLTLYFTEGAQTTFTVAEIFQ